MKWVKETGSSMVPLKGMADQLPGVQQMLYDSQKLGFDLLRTTPKLANYSGSGSRGYSESSTLPSGHYLVTKKFLLSSARRG